MNPPQPDRPSPEPTRRVQVMQRIRQVLHRILPVTGAGGDAHLADTARQLDIMLRSIGEAVLAADVQGRLVRMNPAAESLLLRWAVDAIGQPVDGLFELRTHDQDGRRCDPVGRLLSGAELERAERLVLRRHDGTDRIVSLVATPIRDGGTAVSGVVLVMRDITSENQLEAQVRRTQRVESLAQLAGGVAHDFNNLLQVVRVNLEFLAEKKGLDAEACEYVGEIQHATGRAADLTRQLLALGRRQALRRQPLDPMALIEPFVRVMQRVLGESVEVVFNPEPPVEWVCADASQLEQVLLNLAANARDAMPLGGRLTLGIRMAVLTEADARQESWARPGRWVSVSVTDTGLGMDDATLAHIFEPFFTTKELGKGTGLGLSVVLGVVQQHEGLVHVTSRLGHGTTFEFFLPAVPRPTQAQPAPAAVRTTVPSVGVEPCVLLVEDDPSVRVVSTAVLVRHGFRVVEASDGVQACDLVKARGHEFSLVVMDVIMPRMGGIEAAREIRQVRPGLPIILCTGYAGGSGVPDLGDGDDPYQVLAKPFGTHDLIRAVSTATGVRR